VKPDVRVLVVGEAPGRDENVEGRPFWGQSAAGLGRLLKALGLEWSSVYITNAVKCHMSAWKATTKLGWHEVQTCKKAWLIPELKLLKPYMVIALGLTAMRSLVDDPSLHLNLKETHEVWPQLYRFRNGEAAMVEHGIAGKNAFWLCPFYHPSPRNKWLFPRSQHDLERHPLIMRYRTLIEQARSNGRFRRKDNEF
jgi:uracil-DNA glycosylase family 4